MKSFRVAVLANLKENAPVFDGMSEDQWDDLDSESTVLSLVNAIREGGHQADFLEADDSIIDTVRDYKPDICFNIAESHFGDSREAQIPAILEKLQIPYTGSKILTLALTLDKPMTKRILAWHNLPTPEFQSFEREDEPWKKGWSSRFLSSPAEKERAWASAMNPFFTTRPSCAHSFGTFYENTSRVPWWNVTLKGARLPSGWLAT